MFRNKFLAVLLAVSFSGAAAAQPTPSAEIRQSLLTLNELGTVLMIGAHPDDERTEVLANFAHGRNMRAAYLSLTRGEGGQNLLGSEQGAALGLVRTQELMAARKIDGAEQFFTRAIDFGFSKTAEETMQIWGREKILSDIVWVIRKFRPDIVILCFSGTPRDGHGHHQASAILGREAFDIAGDPTKFPEQLKYVQVWKPARIFGGGRGVGEGMAPSAQIDTSGYNPILGYSYAQLATMSRSQHRSQGMGAMGVGGGMTGGRGGPSGPTDGRRDIATPGATPQTAAVDVFDGIDHSWGRLAGGSAVGAILSQAIREFDWDHPDKTIPVLAKARPLIAAMSDPIAKVKLAQLDETIAACAGIWADAQARQGEATPDSRVPVLLTVAPRLPVEVRIRGVRPEGLWTGKPIAIPGAAAGQRIPDIELDIPADQPHSEPFWLQKPPSGGAYTIEDQTLIGVPDSLVELMRFELTVEGTPVELLRPVVYRYNDRLGGERVRPLAIVPEVSVNVPLGPDMSPIPAVFPNPAARRLQVAVTANVADVQGELRIEVPGGWSVKPATQSFRLTAVDDRQELAFDVTPPEGEATGQLRAVATVGAKQIAAGMAEISYAHIPQLTVFPPSSIKLVRSDIQVTARRVGYIMGAGDEVPESLRQLGLEITMLGEEELRAGDLSRFDAIVAGVRAYNVRPDLRAYHSRVMEYVRNGGTYVVQYMSAGAQNIGPYPIAIPSGNTYRVTVEGAPMTFPDPQSPLLLKPNRIAGRDFEGWVQERGLLFSTQWDPRYQTVLSSNDPGEEPLPGGELWTRYGKGVYVFTSYAWFRQLPAGVPGAFRLFANLLSAK